MDETARVCLGNVITAIDETAVAIRNVERDAAVALHENNDEPAYRAAMAQKAENLIELAEKGGKELQGIPEFVDIAASLAGFGQRAEQALNLDSVFYMSALLYPEDYRDGDKNDLERFADTLRARLK
ncbi:hypothetical protein [Desulfovibrio inopinatus]|uniref:hypothetical protein n=1 Tax=Desulfovibrio inopinatus TaxID=102109 RepID=UPI0004130207|nr:hypothetical protein [Desulfovibrio inopinatus]